ncbi:CvpA family protein [Novosphingobium terrae]|uniref:CvpA family protein n=1 Tax=Novosphingobium terrae TaxID=2726189 RepID=UPI00197CBDB7|nr:CvpA family protein [Novosphingobium terrae]
MTGFDVTVFVVVGAAASLGFLRGFVQEAISLSAFIVAMAAVHLLQAPLAAALVSHIGSESGADVAAFLFLLLVPYFLVRFLARYLGGAARNSILGPVDRVLGFGFGAVKGTLIVVAGFSLIVLFYDTVWGVGGRPEWITKSRTYPFVNASSSALLKIVSERRKAAADAADADSSASNDDDAPKPRVAPHHRPHHKAG